VPLIRITFS